MTVTLSAVDDSQHFYYAFWSGVNQCRTCKSNSGLDLHYLMHYSVIGNAHSVNCFDLFSW